MGDTSATQASSGLKCSFFLEFSKSVLSADPEFTPIVATHICGSNDAAVVLRVSDATLRRSGLLDAIEMNPGLARLPRDRGNSTSLK